MTVWVFPRTDLIFTALSFEAIVIKAKEEGVGDEEVN